MFARPVEWSLRKLGSWLGGLLAVGAMLVAPSAGVAFNNSFDPGTLAGLACGTGGVDRWCGTWDTDPPQLPSSPAQVLAPLGQVVLERVDEAGVRAFAATGQDFGDFDFDVSRCQAGFFYRGTYSAGGKILACGAGSTLYGQYRSDLPENPATAPGAPLRSGFFTITIEGTPPAVRFSGEISQYLANVPSNRWSGSCSGAVCAVAAPAPTVPGGGGCDAAVNILQRERTAPDRPGRTRWNATEPKKTFCGWRPLRDDVRAGLEGNKETAAGSTFTTCLSALAAATAGGVFPATLPATGPVAKALGVLCGTSILAWWGIEVRGEWDDVVREKTQTPAFEQSLGARASAVAPTARQIFLPRPRLKAPAGLAAQCPAGAARARCARLVAVTARAASASGQVASLSEAVAVCLHRARIAETAQDADGVAIQRTLVDVYSRAMATALKEQRVAYLALARAMRAERLDVRLTKAQAARAARRLGRAGGIPAVVLSRLRSDGFSAAEIRSRFRVLAATPARPLTLTALLRRPPATAALTDPPQTMTTAQLAAIVRALAAQGRLSAALAATLEADLAGLDAAGASARAAAASRLSADAAKAPGRHGLVVQLAVKILVSGG